MKSPINRRVFIKKSAGATAVAMVFPASFLMPESDSRVHADLNWKEMMKNHDLLWKKIPSEMTEAPPLGNGLIGSMIWIEENKIRLHLFRTDVHDHADDTFGWTAYSRPRYQIGYFLLKPKGEITDCDLRLDIYNAELTGRINTSLGSLKI